MSVKKIFFFLTFIIVALTVFEACSANRKMKKKCQDCPEFSQTEGIQQTISQRDEDK